MASDKDLFMDRFQQQIDLLKSMKHEIQEAIGRAEKNIGQLRAGKSVEDVFGPVPPKR